MIKVLLPDMPTADQVLPYLRKIDRNQWYSNFGELERTLCARLSEHCGGAHIATASSATTALELALIALDFKPGSKVLCPSFTFPATATAIVRAGHVPVFADVDPRTWALTPEIAAEHFRQRHFDAVVPVCSMGAAQDAHDWHYFSITHAMHVVIDAAAAFGNTLPHGIVPCVYSLHATKALGAGEGGFVATFNEDYAQRIRELSNFGLRKAGGVSYEAMGTNAKLSEYHAAAALASLDRWEGSMLLRQCVFDWYCEMGLPGIQQARPHDDVKTTVQVALQGVPAQLVASKLFAAGIDTRHWYCPPLHQHPAFERHANGIALPNTCDLAWRSIGLPFHTQLSKKDVQYICMKLREALK